MGVRKGLAFSVELKTKTGRLSKLQRKELEEFAAAGGLALVAWGKEGAKLALDAIQGDVKEKPKCLERIQRPSRWSTSRPSRGTSETGSDSPS